MLSMESFGKLISDKRKEAALTQENFAARLGITAQAVSKWENGLTYPDVTLFPEIAQILDIPISMLFGEEDKREITITKPVFQKNHRSAPLVYNNDRIGCYSTKSVMKIDEESNTVFFTDGSYADLLSNTVKNCGAGEIYIRKAQKRDDGMLDSNVPDNIEQALERFESVRFSIPCSCDVFITKSKSFEIKAKGSKKFISHFKFHVKDNELLIEVDRNNGNDSTKNRIDIFVDLDFGKDLHAVVNGAGNLKSEIPFEYVQFSINGSGKVIVPSVATLKATVNGAGEMRVKNVTEKATLSINGAGDVEFDSAQNTDVSVNGAGALKIRKASGYLNIKVTGSAEVNAGGKVDKLYCKISGGAELRCEELTVTEAELYADNSAQIHIGRIVNSSIEKLSDLSELVVDKRG